jgi:hypothetical protein
MNESADSETKNVSVVGGGKSDGCHESLTCVSSNDGASL